MKWHDVARPPTLDAARLTFLQNGFRNKYWADFPGIVYEDYSPGRLMQMHKSERLHGSLLHRINSKEVFPAIPSSSKDSGTELETKLIAAEEKRQEDIRRLEIMMEADYAVPPIIFLVTPELRFVLLDGIHRLLAAVKRRSFVRCGLVYAVPVLPRAVLKAKNKTKK